MEKLETRKGPGRPRKFAEGRRNTTVRFTPDQYAKLEKSAQDQRRSISEEIEARIARSFQEDALQDIKAEIGRLDTELLDMWRDLFEQAKRRIDGLHAAQSLTEEKVEAAVARALAKARLTIGNGS